MSQNIITSAGLSSVNNNSLNPIFSITYFQPIYDARLDEAIHSGTGVVSASPLISASYYSTEFSSLIGEKIWNLAGTTSAYSVTTTDSFVYQETSAYSTSSVGNSRRTSVSALNSITNTTQYTPSKINQITYSGITKPLSTVYTGTTVSGNGIGDWAFTSMVTCAAQSPDVATSANRDRLFSGVTYAPEVSAGNSTQAIFKCRMNNTVGTFKFNKVALYIQRLNGNGTVDGSYDPVLFSVATLNKTIYKSYDGTQIDNFELDVKLNFSTSAGNTIWYNSDYWTMIPVISGLPNGLHHSGDVSIGVSGLAASWSPEAKLHVTDTSKYQLALSRDRVTSGDTHFIYISATGGLNILPSATNVPYLNYGRGNTNTGIGSTTVGLNNSATSLHSTVVGRNNSVIDGSGYSSIFGGYGSTISGSAYYSTINGGLGHIISGASSSYCGIFGGSNSKVYDSQYCFIANSYDSKIFDSSYQSSIIGGSQNYMDNSNRCTILGGSGVSALSANDSVGIGYGVTLNGTNALIVGSKDSANTHTQASGKNVIVVGSDVNAAGLNGITFGSSATYDTGECNIVGGRHVKVDDATKYSAVFGHDCYADAASVIVAGYWSRAETGSDFSVLLGHMNMSNQPKTVALGSGNQTYSENSFALGHVNSTHTGVGAGVIGAYSGSYGTNSFALGYLTSAGGTRSISIATTTSENYGANSILMVAKPDPGSGRFYTHDNSNQITLIADTLYSYNTGLATFRASGFSVYTSAGDITLNNYDPTGDIVLRPGSGSGILRLDNIKPINSLAMHWDSSTSAVGAVFSSKRFKENIVDLTEDTTKVYDLRPVRYNYIGQEKSLIGLIAEEVYELFPDIVPLDSSGQPLSVNYEVISVLLLQELKKLRKDVDDLKRS